MNDQTFGKSSRDELDRLERAAEAYDGSLRCRLAEVIHKSWTTEPFIASYHTEDFATADAIIASFNVTDKN